MNEYEARLTSAAITFTADETEDALQALYVAAKEYALHASVQTQGPEEYIIPFGRQKGLPMSQVPTGDLVWVRNAMMRNADDPTKDQWRSKNLQDAAILDAEIKRRGAR